MTSASYIAKRVRDFYTALNNPPSSGLPDGADILLTAAAEIDSLEKLVYVPGYWRCAKCKFTLIQASLNAHDGSVTARDTPGDKCPNCASPLWRVTERDAGNEMVDRCEAAVVEAADLRRELDRLRSDLEFLLALEGEWKDDPVQLRETFSSLRKEIDRLTKEARAVEPNDTTIEAVSRALARCAWVRFNARDSAFARMKYPYGESQYVDERHHIYRDDARAAIDAALSKATGDQC